MDNKPVKIIVISKEDLKDKYIQEIIEKMVVEEDYIVKII